MIEILMDMIVTCMRDVLVGIAGRHTEELALKLLKRMRSRHQRAKRRARKQQTDEEISTWGKE